MKELRFRAWDGREMLREGTVGLRGQPIPVVRQPDPVSIDLRPAGSLGIAQGLLELNGIFDASTPGYGAGPAP